MFVKYNKEKNQFPIKVWLRDEGQIEGGCLEQAFNLSNLPFIHKWVSLMPDTHQGMGMPIGGVIPTINTIIPNAVGVDIGCGMAFLETNIKVAELKGVDTGNGTIVQAIIGDILRNVPVGFSKHKTPQPCYTMEQAMDNMALYDCHPDAQTLLENAFFQVGTLGGGNHFIELQEDQDGNLGIMIHSGSRNLGKQVCDHFNKLAVTLNEKWYSPVPKEWRLAYLPTDSKEGLDYISWMNLALDFACENRSEMMLAVRSILEKYIGKFTNISFEYGKEINCHHNYASLEHHYDKNVWVHRKGATRARNGELAVIPGAMGSFSYVVMGTGNAESFHSSSHGAGRRLSRKAAMANFTAQEVIEDLNQQNVVLGKRSKADVAEESRFAYKNIDEVMSNQTDLVVPVKKLHTIGVVKG